MSYYQNSNHYEFPQGQPYSSSSAPNSSHSSPLQRHESANGMNMVNGMQMRNQFDFLDDFVHNNNSSSSNYQGSNAQHLSHLFSNETLQNNFLHSGPDSRQNGRPSQSLAGLTLPGDNDGNFAHKDVGNAFNWDGASRYGQGNVHGDGNGNGGQISNPMQSSHEWPQPSISSFTSSGFNTSNSIGWPNSYQSAQLAQEQEWQADANRRSLQQNQAEQQALLAEAEQISKRFQSANQSSQSSPSPEEVKTEQQTTNPAIPDQTSSTLSPTKKAPRSKSAKSVKSAKPLEAAVKKDAGAIKSSSSDSAHKNTTNTKKRKFTPATVAIEAQVQDDVVDSDGRHRYPCLHAGCGKTFSTSGHRARHARIHTGIKPYRCTFPDCGACFSRQDNGLQHFRTHKIGTKGEQEGSNDGGYPDAVRAQMVKTALDQGTAIEIVKGNQESRVGGKSTTAPVVRSTSQARKGTAASSRSKAETGIVRSSKRVKMEKTPSLDPSTDSTASSSSDTPAASSRLTRRSGKSRELEADLPMLSVSLSSPSYSNHLSVGSFSSNGSSQSAASSTSMTSTNPSTVASPIFQTQEQREKQLQYSDSLRQQMLMMPIGGKILPSDDKSAAAYATPRDVKSDRVTLDQKALYHSTNLTPESQDTARQNSFSDAFRGAFPQVATPDIAIRP